ncbi:MAG: class II aldolase/adducin family protein [Candidatus Latescibacteria bacterium]|nr:class II aldolase/adducin family protein [Candidatus Latescibacterota bacterium]
MTNLQQAKADIIHVGKRMYDRVYVASNDGNISVRLSEDRLLVTVTGVSKGFLTPEQLVVIDYEGKVVSGRGKPSSEIKMHLMVYQERPDVHGVAHAHPPTATGFAVAGIPLTECMLPEVIVVLGSVPIVEYGTPGTSELVEPIRKYVKDYDAFLLENHGALTIGPNVINAYHKMETIEHFAKIALVARLLGNVNTLGQTDVEKLLKLRERFGVTTTAVCQLMAERPKSASVTGQPGVAGIDRSQEQLVQQITQEVVDRLRTAAGETGQAKIIPLS